MAPPQQRQTVEEEENRHEDVVLVPANPELLCPPLDRPDVDRLRVSEKAAHDARAAIAISAQCAQPRPTPIAWHNGPMTVVRLDRRAALTNTHGEEGEGGNGERLGVGEEEEEKAEDVLQPLSAYSGVADFAQVLIPTHEIVAAQKQQQQQQEAAKLYSREGVQVVARGGRGGGGMVTPPPELSSSSQRREAWMSDGDELFIPMPPPPGGFLGLASNLTAREEQENTHN